MCHCLCTVCVSVDCERFPYGTHGLSVSKSSVGPLCPLAILQIMFIGLSVRYAYILCVCVGGGGGG